ncbi:MAG: DUF362 domain-containing protein [Anaerolineales bacterium]|nr:DUF362 domain-containing protein [Anaerolineales bacterium]
MQTFRGPQSRHPIHAAHVRSVDDLAGLLAAAGVRPGPTIIKVNWFGPEYGYFTDAQTLDFVLRALPAGEKFVVEGHAYGRNDGSRTLDWRDLDAVRANWDWLREQDAWFQRSTGLADVLERHNARYVNVTDEVWAGRTVPPETVAAAVEARFAPIVLRELYDFMPARLWELRGATLISLARIKVRSPNALAADPSPYSPIFSLAIKNLFGLVPDPFRFRWHGRQGQSLAQSLVDITKIYSAVFDLVGCNEGLFQLLVNDPIGAHETNWGRYDILCNQGVALAGRALIALDTVTASMFFPLDWQRWPLFALARPDLGPVEEALLGSVPAELLPVVAECRRRYTSSIAVENRINTI